jgi:hypothetical protein
MSTRRFKHLQTREQDEFACTCGLRWGVKERDPHRPNKPKPRARHSLRHDRRR